MLGALRLALLSFLSSFVKPNVFFLCCNIFRLKGNQVWSQDLEQSVRK